MIKVYLFMRQKRWKSERKSAVWDRDEKKEDENGLLHPIVKCAHDCLHTRKNLFSDRVTNGLYRANNDTLAGEKRFSRGLPKRLVERPKNNLCISREKGSTLLSPFLNPQHTSITAWADLWANTSTNAKEGDLLSLSVFVSRASLKETVVHWSLWYETDAAWKTSPISALLVSSI